MTSDDESTGLLAELRAVYDRVALAKKYDLWGLAKT